MILFLNIGIQAHIEFQLAGKTCRQVHCRSVAFHIFAFHRAAVVRVAKRRIIAGLFITARNADCMRLGECVTTQDVKPIGVGGLIPLHLVKKLVIGSLPCLKPVIRALISYHRHILWKHIMKVTEVLAKLHTLLRVHQIDVLVGISRTLRIFELGRIPDGRRSLLTLFGCHDYNAVGGSGAIERSGGSILQHVDAVDVLRIDAGDSVTYIIDIIRVIELFVAHIDRILDNKAVEHPQRLAVADKSRGTAHTQTRRRSYRAGVLREHKVRNTAFKCLVDRSHVRHQDVVHLYGSHRCGSFSSVKFLIADHSDFGKSRG